MTLFCEPHKPGTIWDAAIHGAVIPTEHALLVVYNFEGAERARACMIHGIPTGYPIPKMVRDLAYDAHGYQGQPEANLFWASAQQELAKAAAAMRDRGIAA